MKIYVDNELRIIDVGTSDNAELTEYEVTDGTFDGWAKAKVCSYRAEVVDGNVTMLTPYVNTDAIPQVEHIAEVVEAENVEQLGALVDQLYADDLTIIFGEGELE